MKKTKVNKKWHIGKAAVMSLAAVILALTPLQGTFADSYDDQINALKSQISDYQSQAVALKQQADTYQNAVNVLSVQKQQIQAQIDLNTTKIAQLNQQIVDAQAKMEQQKTLLGNNLVSLYLDNKVTPLELLASSKSISDYIDKQEYRDTIRQQLQDSIAQIKKLQAQLDDDKKKTQEALADQQAQRDDLAAKEQQQAILLAQTQGQEAAYQNQISQSNAQITTLRAQQAAANLKWGGNVTFQPRGGGYPSFWADIPMDSTIDDWGMYNRECVSYAAFRVAASGRHMPYWGGRGNAIQWPGDARSDGIPVDSNPQAGDVAIWPVGYYGHAMYVESVNNSGDLLISEYNFDWSGRYSSRTVTSSTWHAQGFQFIHF